MQGRLHQCIDGLEAGPARPRRPDDLGPDEPASEQHDEHVRTNLEPESRQSHRYAGHVQDHRRDENQCDGSAGLGERGDEGEDDAVAEGLSRREQIRRNHRLAMTRTSRMDDAIEEGKRQQSPHGGAVVTDGADSRGHMLVEIDLHRNERAGDPGKICRPRHTAVRQTRAKRPCLRCLA